MFPGYRAKLLKKREGTTQPVPVGNIQDSDVIAIDEENDDDVMEVEIEKETILITKVRSINTQELRYGLF